jgi:hypothetical protein
VCHDSIYSSQFQASNSSKHKHTHDDQALSIMTIASVRVPAASFVLTFLPHCALCLQGDQRRLVLPLLGRFLMLPLLVLGRPTSSPPRRHNQGGLPLQIALVRSRPLLALIPCQVSIALLTALAWRHLPLSPPRHLHHHTPTSQPMLNLIA